MRIEFINNIAGKFIRLKVKFVKVKTKKNRLCMIIEIKKDLN